MQGRDRRRERGEEEDAGRRPAVGAERQQAGCRPEALLIRKRTWPDTAAQQEHTGQRKAERRRSPLA
jgi:hypothetical protein